MGDLTDLELIIKSRIPIVIIESHEETRAVDMFKRLAFRVDKPLFLWSVTEGLRRLDIDFGSQTSNADPARVLRHIKSTGAGGLYLLLDFHPYIEDPVNARLIKEIAHAYHKLSHTLVFISHELEVPPDLHKMTARFELALPDEAKLEQIIKEEAFGWSRQNGNRKVHTDSKTLARLVRNLGGLTVSDARRLARKVIYDDGAITESDLPRAMKAKYDLLGKDGLLTFEYDTEKFADVGGMDNVKRWLELRKEVFYGEPRRQGLESPKGMLLLGVQGCGKSAVLLQ